MYCNLGTYTKAFHGGARLMSECHFSTHFVLFLIDSARWENRGTNPFRYQSYNFQQKYRFQLLQ